MNSPRPRVIKRRLGGAETEIGLRGFPKFCQDDEILRLWRELIAGTLPENRRERFSKSAHRATLLNQGRCYKDSEWLEYATPECISAKETTLQETAGLGIITKAIERFKAKHARFEKLSAHKCNRNTVIVDGPFSGNSHYISSASLGSHGNYIALRNYSGGGKHDPPIGFGAFESVLETFFLSRSCIMGNGWFEILPRGGIRFLLSQRTDVTLARSSHTPANGDKPLFNPSDEAHARADIWRRFHDVAEDSNMSEVQIYLKRGIMDILLALAEAEDFFISPPSFGDERFARGVVSGHTAIGRFWNTDPRAQSVVLLDNGEYWSALDFQFYLLEEAHRYFREGRGPLTEERREVLALWEETLGDISRFDLAKLSTYLDWAAVLYRAIIPYCEGAGIDSERLILPGERGGHFYDAIAYDTPFETKRGRAKILSHFLQTIIEYANVDVGRGIYGTLLKRGLMRRLFSDEEKLAAETMPPMETRANYREALLGAVAEKRPSWAVNETDWMLVKCDNGNIRYNHYMRNPYRARIPEISEPFEQWFERYNYFK